jgi:hypothetical protein
MGELIEGRYYTTMLGTIAIVASIGDHGDWAAYICDCRDDDSIEGSMETAAKYGAKLSEADARYYFPDVKEKYRL